MSDPVIDPSDLGVYLNDDDIDTSRATAFIADAQALCESVVSPLPTGADVVVKRVAARAYVTVTQSRQLPVVVPGMGMEPSAAAGGLGGVWLSRADVADLRRLNGGGGAFTIDLLPSGYVLPVCYPSWYGDWDQIP